MDTHKPEDWRWRQYGPSQNKRLKMEAAWTPTKQQTEDGSSMDHHKTED